MSAYTISNYSKKQAKRLNVVIKPSTRKGKKIDVYDKKIKKELASIGALGYGDCPTFKRTHNKAYADKKKKCLP